MISKYSVWGILLSQLLLGTVCGDDRITANEGNEKKRTEMSAATIEKVISQESTSFKKEAGTLMPQLRQQQQQKYWPIDQYKNCRRMMSGPLFEREKDNPVSFQTTDPVAREVLVFWFGEPNGRDYGKPRAAWFQKDAQFDETIIRRFGTLHQQASEGKWHNWQSHPETMLALIIVLDQFSRHIYRATAKAFSADAQVLSLANKALARNFDLQVMPLARVFYYLPFEHSENLTDQQRAVNLFTCLQQEEEGLRGFTEYAQRHYDVIAQFGRFPHRNNLLGRFSSADEQHYLNQAGAGF